jgi:hypothetical protein
VGENQFLVDTDILIAYFNHRSYRSYLENPLNRIYYSAMTKKELLSKPGAGSELVDGQTRFFNLKISFQAGQKGFRCEARDG